MVRRSSRRDDCVPEQECPWYSRSWPSRYRTELKVVAGPLGGLLSSVKTSPLGRASNRTTRALGRGAPAEVERAAFIFHVPKASWPAPEAAKSSRREKLPTRQACGQPAQKANDNT